MTTRKDIIDLFVQKLSQIRIANGYTCDIGQLVEYGKVLREQPTQDCVAVFATREEFGPLRQVSNTSRERSTKVSISAAYVGNDPLARADMAYEDFIKWLDANPSLGTRGIRVELVAITSELEEEYGEFAETLCELKVTY